eukprot:gnl/Chilomastix_cuspidata/599.p1 GENE.gnl/Chilomastix_cuspidata/599~~gnl/Chilomastix_cuspidata/599.p1  ORF type:complete len:980 (+),score=429.31 gnl/Chilomastix_cuspidata/599:24-2963(+)
MIKVLLSLVFCAMTLADSCGRVGKAITRYTDILAIAGMDLNSMFPEDKATLFNDLIDVTRMCTNEDFNTENINNLSTFPSLPLLGIICIPIWFILLITALICHPCYRARCCTCCTSQRKLEDLNCRFFWTGALGLVILCYVLVFTFAFFGGSEFGAIVEDDALGAVGAVSDYLDALPELLTGLTDDIVASLPETAEQFSTDVPVGDLFAGAIDATSPLLDPISSAIGDITEPIFADFNDLFSMLPQIPTLLETLVTLPVTYVWGLLCPNLEKLCSVPIDFGSALAPNLQTFGDVLGLAVDSELVDTMRALFPDEAFSDSLVADLRLEDDAYWEASADVASFFAAISETFFAPQALRDILETILDAPDNALSAQIEGLIPIDDLSDKLDNFSIISDVAWALSSQENFTKLVETAGIGIPMDGTLGDVLYFGVSHTALVIDAIWLVLLITMFAVAIVAMACSSKCCACTLNCFSGASCWLCAILTCVFGLLSLALGVLCVVFTDAIYTPGRAVELADEANQDLGGALDFSALQDMLTGYGMNYDLQDYMDWLFAHVGEVLTCQSMDFLHALNIPATFNQIVQASDVPRLLRNLLSGGGDFEQYLQTMVAPVMQRVAAVNFTEYLTEERKDQISNVVSVMNAFLGGDATVLLYALIDGLTSMNADIDTLANVIVSYHMDHGNTGSYLDICGYVAYVNDGTPIADECDEAVCACIASGDCDAFKASSDAATHDNFLLLKDIAEDLTALCASASAPASCATIQENIRVGSELAALDAEYDTFIQILNPVLTIVSNILAATIENIEDVIASLEELDLSAYTEPATDGLVDFALDNFDDVATAAPGIVGDLYGLLLESESGSECLSCAVIGNVFEPLNCAICDDLPGFVGYTGLAMGVLAVTGLLSMVVGACAALRFRKFSEHDPEGMRSHTAPIVAISDAEVGSTTENSLSHGVAPSREPSGSSSYTYETVYDSSPHFTVEPLNR